MENNKLPDEKLPENNQIKKCPRCGKEYPLLKLYVFIGEKTPRLYHNFCPTSTADGKLIYLCMECKVIDNAARRGDSRW